MLSRAKTCSMFCFIFHVLQVCKRQGSGYFSHLQNQQSKPCRCPCLVSEISSIKVANTQTDMSTNINGRSLRAWKQFPTHIMIIIPNSAYLLAMRALVTAPARMRMRGAGRCQWLRMTLVDIALHRSEITIS